MIVIVMGVVGAGKTTVGRLLAEQLGWEFADADDFHPPSNVEKIRRGIALNDEDRKPWLERLSAAISQWIAEHRNVLLACSALKRCYRHSGVIGLGANLPSMAGLPVAMARSAPTSFSIFPLSSRRFWWTFIQAFCWASSWG